jgi:hypothetical protein
MRPLFEHITGMTQLSQLTWTPGRYGPRTVSQTLTMFSLAAALPDLPALRSLTLDDWDLTMQDIDGTGGVRVPARPSWQRLTDALAMLTQLTDLGLGDVWTRPGEGADFLSALGFTLAGLTSLRGLTIGMVFPGGEAYRGMRESEGYMRPAGHAAVSQGFAAAVGALTQLTSLCLEGMASALSVRDCCLRLTGLTRLCGLALGELHPCASCAGTARGVNVSRGDRTTGTWAGLLPRLTHLTELRLYSDVLLRGEVQAVGSAVLGMPDLECLHITGNGLDAADCSLLVNLLRDGPAKLTIEVADDDESALLGQLCKLNEGAGRALFAV